MKSTLDGIDKSGAFWYSLNVPFYGTSRSSYIGRLMNEQEQIVRQLMTGALLIGHAVATK